LVATRTNDVTGTVAALGAPADDLPGMPVVAVLVGVTDPPVTLGTRRIPVYPLPENAVRALGHAARYASWLRTPLGSRPDLSDVDSGRAREVAAAALAAGGGWQPPEVARALLDCYRIPMLTTHVVDDPVLAIAAATQAGFPAVLKAADPALVHKSDLGVVHLNLPDAAAVHAAYDAVGAALGQDRPLVAVQPMAAVGVELVAGVVHDPLFGSLVMLGLGGVHTDLLGDRAFRLLPVTDLDAARMWRTLRAAPLLTGYRGAPPVDLTAVEDLLVRIGRMAEDLPQLAELDLNPVLAGPSGVVAVDIKLRLADIGGEPDPYLRALSEPR
jgi:acyl-CoA synthetase (NDP forming)